MGCINGCMVKSNLVISLVPYPCSLLDITELLIEFDCCNLLGLFGVCNQGTNHHCLGPQEGHENPGWGDT
jgi:hypothetical protein